MGGYKKRQKMKESSRSHRPRPTPSAHHPDPVSFALAHPEILESVFRYLNLESLKECRRVCSKWSEIAKPSLHPDCVILIGDAGNTERYTIHGLAELEGANLPCGIKYVIAKTKSNLPQILDKIKGTVRSLWLNMDYKANFELLGNLECQELFTRIRLPYLKSLRLMKYLPRDSGTNAAEVNKKFTLALLEIIKRAPNLQELEFYQDHLPVIFWDTLLGPEGLVRNKRVMNTLDTLGIHFDDMHLNPDHIDALRKMNLKLKKLTLSLSVAVDDDDVVRLRYVLPDDRKLQFAAFSNWIKGLRSSLETCHLTNFLCMSMVSKKLKFLTEMKVLKELRIDGLQMLDDGIILLLKKMPKLEKLDLSHASSTGAVVEDAFVDNFHEFRFPNLKELTFRTEGIEELNPSRYFSKLFPNLQKLTMLVYSKKTFLSCIHQFKDMRIEELKLDLKLLPKDCKTDGITSVPWGWEVPSFASWKRLRELKLSNCEWYGYGNFVIVPQDNTMTHIRVYNMSLKYVLHGSLLTSLILNDFENIDAKVLIKLLQGLPRLMSLDMCNGSVVDKSGNVMKWSELRHKISNELLISQNLRFYNLQTGEEDSDTDPE